MDFFPTKCFEHPFEAEVQSHSCEWPKAGIIVKMGVPPLPYVAWLVSGRSVSRNFCCLSLARWANCSLPFVDGEWRYYYSTCGNMDSSTRSVIDAFPPKRRPETPVILCLQYLKQSGPTTVLCNKMSGRIFSCFFLCSLYCTPPPPPLIAQEGKSWSAFR